MSLVDILTSFTGLLLLVALLVVIFILFRNKRKLVTYYIYDSTIDPNFKSIVMNIIKSSYINNKYDLLPTNDLYNADVTIELVDRKDLTDRSKYNFYKDKVEYYPGTTKQIYFSFTSWERNHKPSIRIDSENWKGVAESGLSQYDYRRYVIQHEFMHALGYDHQPCNNETTINGVCPILYQATRGPPKGFKAGTEVTDVDYSIRLPYSFI